MTGLRLTGLRLTGFSTVLPGSDSLKNFAALFILSSDKQQAIIVTINLYVYFANPRFIVIFFLLKTKLKTGTGKIKDKCNIACIIHAYHVNNSRNIDFHNIEYQQLKRKFDVFLMQLARVGFGGCGNRQKGWMLA